jgi:hypothetical protein
MTSSLKKLLKKRPSGEDIVRCVKELSTDGERGAAVLSSALLEDLTRLAIVTKMVDLTPEEHDRLFVGAGPLSSFSTKIQIAYALGLIGRRTRHDLDAIREIRNAFAHTNLEIGFETPEVAAQCNGLHCLSALDEPEDIAKASTPRKKFEAATKILMLHLVSKWIPPEGNPFLPAKIVALS